ncbi:MAG TPA: peptidylprolyl isomerase [Xanthobacteraceae bacterium]
MLGAALFAAYHGTSARSSRQDSLVVTEGQIEHLTTGFTRSWRRPPTADELRDLIRNYVREEVYYREAKEMGLDRDDPVIRRRLQQKLEFVSEDIAAQKEPSDAELEALLQAEPERFRTGQSFTFRHVYLNPERHRGDLTRIAASLLDQLTDGAAAADTAAVGDRFLLATSFEAISRSEAAKLFGGSFADCLSQLGLQKWQGPVKSGYGVHLVFLEERVDGRIPALDEAREALLGEWKERQRSKASEQFYRKLLSRYSVTVEAGHRIEIAPDNPPAALR